MAAATHIALLFAVFVIFVAGGVFALAYVLLRRRARFLAGPPRCGYCGYNLTASESNRCPECGKLFIEAGVTHQERQNAAGQRPFLIALILGLVVAASLSFTMVMGARAVASARQAQAAAAAAAARQALLQQQLLGDQAEKTARSNAAAPQSARRSGASSRPAHTP